MKTQNDKSFFSIRSHIFYFFIWRSESFAVGISFLFVYSELFYAGADDSPAATARKNTLFYHSLCFGVMNRRVEQSNCCEWCEIFYFLKSLMCLKFTIMLSIAFVTVVSMGFPSSDNFFYSFCFALRCFSRIKFHFE